MRKALYIFAALFILLTSNIFSQDFKNLWQPTGGPYDVNTSAIAFKPGGYIYISTEDNGVLRSTDNGATWKLLDCSGITGLAVAPDGTLYGAVTLGLLKSTDNGETWKGSNSGLTYGADCVAIDPTTGFLYAGCYRGIWRSTDKGENWSQVHDDPVGTSVIVADGKGHIYAGGNGIFVSENNGGSWFKTSNWPDRIAVTALAKDPKGAIYFGDAQGGLFKSTDEAFSFSRLSSIGVNYIASVAIDSAGTVYVGTLENGVYRSQDGGLGWKQINKGITNTIIQHVAAAPDGKIYAGVRTGAIFYSQNKGDEWQQLQPGVPLSLVRDLMIHSNGDIYASSSNAGLYRSTDKGLTWNECSNGLNNVGSYSLLLNKAGEVFFSTNKGVYKSADKADNWKKSDAGLDDKEFYFMKIDSSGQIYGFAKQFDKYELYKSTDNGLSYKLVSDYFLTTSVNSFDIAPNGELFVAAMGSNGFFRSKDGGLTWEKKENVLAPDSYGMLRAVIADTKGQLFAAASEEKGVYRSTDNGESWVRSTGNLDMPGAEIITSDGKGQVFVTNHFYVSRSTDNGNTWTKIVDTDNYHNILSMAFHPDGTLFLGTAHGVYKFDPATSGFSEVKAAPSAFALMQNYPNPFNPETKISYSLSKASNVELKVYDMLGREVSLLVSQHQSAGEYTVKFDGSSLPSGIYIYTIKAGEFSASKKLMLVK